MRKGIVKKLILHVLRDKGPMHPYGLIKAIEEMTFSTYRPSTGVIYPALESLIKEELITVIIKGDRKLYKITEKGKVAISLDRPIREHIEKIMRTDLPYKELSQIYKILIDKWDMLNEADKEAIKAIIKKMIREIEEVVEDKSDN